jgi:hypothetical protein
MSQSTTNNFTPASTELTHVSSTYDGEYSRTKVITSLLNPDNNEYIPEFFSLNYRRLINNIYPVGVGAITAKPLTTSAYKLYQNTTCWWMIALLNGFGNPLTVPSSTIIGLPDITVLNNIDNVTPTLNLNQSNVTI